MAVKVVGALQKKAKAAKLDNGLSFGYVLSSERYEDERKLSVVKEGQTYNYTRTFIEQGVFNTIFLGITF